MVPDFTPFHPGYPVRIGSQSSSTDQNPLV